MNVLGRQDGKVRWDVTGAVQEALATSATEIRWLLRTQGKGKRLHARFYSAEGAANEGPSATSPMLRFTYVQ